jgi:hypothetical protein
MLLLALQANFNAWSLTMKNKRDGGFSLQNPKLPINRPKKSRSGDEFTMYHSNDTDNPKYL